MKIKFFISAITILSFIHSYSVNHDLTVLRSNATEYALSHYIRQDYGSDSSTRPVKLQDGSIKLPASINNLPIYCHQFKVVRQKEEGTCGSRSVANALAVHDTLIHGRMLNSANVRAESLKYEHLHVKNGMNTREEIELAQKYGLKNAFCLSLMIEDPIHSEYYNKYPFTIIDSCHWGQIKLYEEDSIISKINHLIRSQKTIDVHFLCHLDSQKQFGGHGVVISLIKQEGLPTRMIYMDSNNIPLTDNSQATAYMEYIYWQFIA